MSQAANASLEPTVRLRRTADHSRSLERYNRLMVTGDLDECLFLLLDGLCTSSREILDGQA